MYSIRTAFFDLTLFFTRYLTNALYEEGTKYPLFNSYTKRHEDVKFGIRVCVHQGLKKNWF